MLDAAGTIDEIDEVTEPAPAPRSFRPRRRAEPATAPAMPSRYGETRTNWLAIAAIVLGHVALVAALAIFDVIPIAHNKPKPLAVFDIAEPPPPPVEIPLEVPPPAAAPEQLVIPPPLVVHPQPQAVKVEAIESLTPPPPAPAIAATPTPGPVTTPAPVTPPDFTADYLRNPAPRYPLDSRRAKEQGTVMVKVLVSPAGTVQDIKIARSSGYDRLDNAALSAIKHWRFSPAKQAGEPVAAWVMVPIPFILKA